MKRIVHASLTERKSMFDDTGPECSLLGQEERINSEKANPDSIDSSLAEKSKQASPNPTSVFFAENQVILLSNVQRQTRNPSR